MAKDFIHYFVKEALIKEGWKVTDDPLSIILAEDETFFEVDLAIEKKSISKSINKILAIEIKSFQGGSIINAFHEALGQFLNYKAAIQEQNLGYDLFLAVSEIGWKKINSYKFIQRRIAQFGLQFLIVNTKNKTISKWIKRLHIEKS